MLYAGRAVRRELNDPGPNVELIANVDSHLNEFNPADTDTNKEGSAERKADNAII
jgi:hypothetical protein